MAPSSGGAASLARRVALSLASVLATLALGECALRVRGAAPSRFYAMRELESPDKRHAVDAYPSDPRGYFSLDLRDPATRARLASYRIAGLDRAAQRAPHGVEFTYSSDLCRDREAGPRTPGVARVLVLGDSFTEGQGVREEDTFARRIERALRAEGTAVDVRNCGRRGRDFPALYETFAQHLDERPDVIVYAMVLNDAAQSEAFHARQEFLNDWIQDRRRQSDDDDPSPGALGPLDSRLRALLRDRYDALRVGRETTRWYRDMYAAPNADGWLRTQAFLSRMNDESARVGASFRVALLPLLTGLDRAYPFESTHATIATACRARAIRFTDVLPALRGRDPTTLWVHAVDMHPNERAHGLIADALVSSVRDDLRAHRDRVQPPVR